MEEELPQEEQFQEQNQYMQEQPLQITCNHFITNIPIDKNTVDDVFEYYLRVFNYDSTQITKDIFYYLLRIENNVYLNEIIDNLKVLEVFFPPFSQSLQKFVYLLNNGYNTNNNVVTGWFQGFLDYKTANEMLKETPDKTFLVRFGDPPNFTLHFKKNGDVHPLHMKSCDTSKIEITTKNGFKLFNNLEHVIESYTQENKLKYTLPIHDAKLCGLILKYKKSTDTQVSQQKEIQQPKFYTNEEP